MIILIFEKSTFIIDEKSKRVVILAFDGPIVLRN